MQIFPHRDVDVGGGGVLNEPENLKSHHMTPLKGDFSQYLDFFFALFRLQICK